MYSVRSNLLILGEISDWLMNGRIIVPSKINFIPFRMIEIEIG